MNVAECLFNPGAPSLKELYDFARIAAVDPMVWSTMERVIDDRYAQDTSLRDAYARLALLAAHCPVLPEREMAAFDRIHSYGKRDRDQGRLTASGRVHITQARRRMARLLELLRAAEVRTGLSLREQWNRLVHALGSPNPSTEPLPILNARLKIASAFDALVLYQELVLEDAYAFACSRSDPFIIDGGANIGMAMACFKWRYPDARILAFEPNPELYELCRENIKLNAWKHVDLQSCALAPQEGECSLRYSMKQPMASTLTNRISKLVPPATLQVARVNTKPLSAFLPSSGVDYLKLDIEGVEGDVLQEVGAALSGVRQGFIEYHYDPDATHNSLASILFCLENNAFRYRVLQPPAEQTHAPGNVPLLMGQRTWSSNIYFQKANM